MYRPNTFSLLVAAALVFVPGCSGSSVRFPDPSPTNTEGAYVSRTETVKAGTTEYVADFGTITVPENRSKTLSRLLHLPFIRVRSSSSKPKEPIFCLSGGPGASNMKWNWGIMWYLLQEHDIVTVGYRGADGSTVLNCPEVASAYAREADLLSDDAMRTIGQAWSASWARLRAQGVDLDGYTMLEVIEDNEAVRTALGYTRINLLSASYGTRVAYLYGLKHQDRIARSAMIAVNPPGRFVWDPKMIDRQLKHYAILWSRDPTAVAQSTDLYATIRNVLDNMPHSWFGLPINRSKVKIVTFFMLFHRETAAMVFDAFVHADHGDPSGLALMSIACDFVMDPFSMIWGDLASKAVSADFDSARNYSLDMEPPGIPLGSPLSKITWGALMYGRWSMRGLPGEFRTAHPSDVETLLLSGSIDFSTPAEYATHELLPYLGNGKQIVLSEYGHFNDIAYLMPENTRRILTGFYETGVPDVSMNTYVPMDFHVRWGLPTIAKAGLITVGIVGAAFIGGIAWLVGKVW